MDESVRSAVNRQIGHELKAGYLYLAMSAYFERTSLLGFASWMRAQAQEELGHALRLFDFMNHRGVSVDLPGIEAPPVDFGGALEVFEEAQRHEEEVTRLIHDLYDLCVEKHDHATQLELNWFVTEQVEEEASVGTIVDQLKMAGDNEAAVLMLDRELGRRGEG